MPLKQSSSKQAFKDNLKAEIGAGKPMKQSLAIAYAVKKKNHKARGGMINSEEALSDADKFQLSKEDLVKENELSMGGEKTGHPVKNDYYASDEMAPKFMAKGGMMDPKAMAHIIIMKKKAHGGMAGYAEGGLVNDEDMGRDMDDSMPSHNISSGSHLKEAADYELNREAGDLANPSEPYEDGEGSMPYDEEALYKSGDEGMEDLRDKLPANAEAEIEGEGSMRQAMARKGMLSRILGNIRSSHYGK